MPSGATIIVLDDVVIKANGGHRIDEQSEWLERYQCDGIVKVLGSWHGGYAMERLDPVGRLITPEEVIDLLQRYVWCHAPQVPLDWAEVAEYGLTKAAQYWQEGYQAIHEQIEKITGMDAGISLARVHGDPTFENIMARDGNLVLIDPVPGRIYAPDIMAVDLGKILQSHCGYEGVLAGDDSVRVADGDFLLDFSYVDQQAAILFGMIHVARFLPYLTDDLRIKMKETVGENMLRLRS